MSKLTWQDDALRSLEVYYKGMEYEDSEMLAQALEALTKLTYNLPALFGKHPVERHNELWDAIYLGCNHQWDRELPSPALFDLMRWHSELVDGNFPRLTSLKGWVGHGFGYATTESDTSRPARRRALVPGCGAGDDATVLAKVFGYEVVGLDVSEEALSLARGREKSLGDLLWGRRKPENIDEEDVQDWVQEDIDYGPPGGVTWILGDFFSDEWLEQLKSTHFDLIFDYQVGRSHSLSPGVLTFGAVLLRATAVSFEVLAD